MDFRYLLIFLSGLIGGATAYVIGAPLPFLLGGFFGSALFVLFYERDGRELPKTSRWIRLIFVSIIGTMIGSRFTPEVAELLPLFWISGLAIIPYILIAHGGCYAIMRKWGHYNQKDAYYASLPGGFVDSINMAEDAKANVGLVTAQHFIRIVLVVVSVPLLFLFVSGDTVGSLAGETLTSNDYDWLDIVQTLAIAWTGLFLGRFLKLPVSHLLVPLTLALLLTVTNVVTINIPEWLQHLAQYMVGTALGAQFSGISRQLLIRSLNMGLLAGVYMLLLAAAFAAILTNYVPAGFAPLFVSFAAGGLAEMSLIAMSLNFAPVVVALHHFLRLLLSVVIGSFLAKRLFDDA